MEIDLATLFEEGEFLVQCQICFPDSYLSNSEIRKIEPITVDAKCFLNDQEIVLSGSLSGTMWLEDAISLELISYPFSCQFEEILEENGRNNAKSLDIMDVLWQNIVLEVPLKQTEVTDFSKYQGDGWKLITEEDSVINNNPFGELVNMWGEE